MNLHGRKICDNCFSVIKGEPCPKCGYKRAKYRPEIGVLPVGTVLARHYTIGQVLGKGGFGVTYKAYDTRNDRVVAIKEYYPNGIAHRDTGTTGVSLTDVKQTETFKTGADKFFDEAKTVSKFNGNPNIVSVYEFFYENNTVYYVMEYLEGCDLKQFVKNNGGKVSEGQAVYILNTLTDALVITHSLNVLHRDISPDNVYVRNTGDIKLIDFGAARQVLAEQSKSLSVILKQGFAPIEQYQRRGKQGPWTDIYALGATIYYAVTGKVPEDATERIDEPSIGSAADYGVSESFWKVIEKCLSVKIDERYQSVYELKADLAKVDTKAVPLIDPGDSDLPLTVMMQTAASGAANTTVTSQNPAAVKAESTPDIPGTVAVEAESTPDIPGTVAVEADTEPEIPGTVAVEAETESEISGTVAVSEPVQDENAGDEENEDRKSPFAAFVKTKKGIITLAGSFAAMVVIIVAAVLVAANSGKDRTASGNNVSISDGEQYAANDTTEPDDSKTDADETEKQTDKETDKETDKQKESEEDSGNGEDDTDVNSETDRDVTRPAETEAPVIAPTTTQPTTTKPTTQPTTTKPTTQPATTAPQPTTTAAATEPSYVTNRSCTVYCGAGNSTSATTLSGGTYTGDWKDGMPNGDGYYVSSYTREDMIYYTIAKGTWKNGKMSGKGSFASGNCFSSKGVPSVTTTDWNKYLCDGSYDNPESVTIYSGTWSDGIIVGESTKYWAIHYKGSSYTLNGEVVTTPDRIEGLYNTKNWVTATGIFDSLQGDEWNFVFAL